MPEETLDDFNNLRQAIFDKISADETTIQEAYFHEVSEFQGSPAAVIGVSQNEALYNSQASDRMTFVFQVRIYIPLVDDEHTEEVEMRMGQAYWEVLRMFKQRDVLQPYADQVEPIPSFWDFEQRGEAVYRYSEINIRCVKWLSNRG